MRARLRSAFDAATMLAPLDQGAVYDGIEVMLSRLAEIVPLVGMIGLGEEKPAFGHQSVVFLTSRRGDSLIFLSRWRKSGSSIFDDTPGDITRRTFLFMNKRR